MADPEVDGGLVTYTRVRGGGCFGPTDANRIELGAHRTTLAGCTQGRPEDRDSPLPPAGATGAARFPLRSALCVGQALWVCKTAPTRSI